MKNFIFLLSFIFGLSQIWASDQIQENPRKHKRLKFKKLHQEKIPLENLEQETQKLVDQGFPQKRAREICAQKQIATVFKTKFKQPLISTEEILKGIGGYCEITINQTDEGVLDDIFTTADIGWLKKGDAPVVYNETHFIENDQPVRLNRLKKLKNQYTYTLPYPDFWNGCLKADISRPCGTVKASLGLLWTKTVLDVQFSLKTRLENARIGHTVTVLKKDGTLILFDVIQR